MARTHANTRTPAAIAIAAGCFFSLSSLSAAALADDPGLLAGPSVTDEQGTSLVERNIDGSMRRPEVPIAEEALRTVDLDASTKAKVDALLADRAAQIDAIVKKNMQTLNTMKTDRQANAGADNERQSRRETGRALMEMFKPVLEKGPLEDQIAALLPEETRTAYLRNIEEHREAMIADRMTRGEGPRGQRGARRGPPPEMLEDDGPMLFEDPMLEMFDDAAAEGESPRERRRDGERRGRPEGTQWGPSAEDARDMMVQLRTLQMEIRRSVERVNGERTDRMDDLVERLGLDAEQEAKVRELLKKAGRGAQESDDPRAARREAMRELAEILTPEQRQILREMRGPRDGNREGRRPRRPAAADD